MKKLVIFAILLCCSAFTLAAGLMKPSPSLWEITIKSDALKNMPKISSGQMKQVGVDIPQMNKGSIITKVCIPKEMAERDQPLPEVMNPNEADCEVRNYQPTGSTYSLDIICDGPIMRGQGTAPSHPLNQHHVSKGRWLSADCGDFAPIDRLDDK